MKTKTPITKVISLSLRHTASLFVITFVMLSQRDVRCQVILNPSFENGTLSGQGIGVLPGDTSIDNWIVGGNGVDYISSNFWQAGDGNRSVDLSRVTAGSISQTIFGLQIGQEYSISFLMAGNADRESFPGQNTDPIKSLVMNVGPFSQQFVFDITPFTRTNMGYALREFHFVANASAMTLTVTSLENNAYGPVVDNFSIAAVPEPSPFALCGLGAACLSVGLVRGRKRSSEIHAVKRCENMMRNYASTNKGPTSQTAMKLDSASIALLVVCACLSACASAADPSTMVPGTIGIHKRFNKTVNLAVTGGQETSKVGASQVADKDLASALQTSIEKCGLFSRVISSGNADYRLDVRLVQLHQPVFGLNMTVTADIEWRVRHLQSDKLVWEKIVSRPYTATMGDAIAGYKRLKLANEGAIRESIKAGLEQISELSL